MSGSADSPQSLPRARYWIPACVGLAVLMLGYLSLLLFWELGVNPAGVPGLFQYRDATWGDGLLLPSLAALLVILIRRLPRTPRQWPTWIAGTLGAAAGGSLILTWWADPHPSPNWTLPAPHNFTVPGKWHAAFLIAASGFFAAAWVELFRRVRSSEKGGAAEVRKAAEVLASPVTAGAVACTAAYAWLAASDSARAAQTASGLGSLLALAASASALIGCLTWAARGSRAQVARTAIAGLLGSAALVVFFDTYGHTGSFMLIAALIGAFGAGVALVGASGHEARFLNLEMVAVPALFALLALLAAHTTRLVIVIIAPLVAMVGSALLRRLYSASDQPWKTWLSANYLAGSGISACLLAAGAFGLWLSAHKANAYITAAFLLTIIGAVLGGVFLPYYKTDYIRLMQIEGDPAMRQPDYHPSYGQHQAAVAAWLRLGGYATAATASMLVLTVALAPSLGWKTGMAQIRWQYPLGIGLIGLILILPTTGALVEASKRHRGKAHLYIPRGGSRYAWCSFLGTVVVSVLGVIWLLRDGQLNGLALAQTTFLVSFAVLTMVDNGALLHVGWVNWRAKLAISTTSFAMFVTVYWSLTNAVRSGGSVPAVGISFAAFIAAVIFVTLLVETTTCAVFVAGGQPYHTDYAPFWGGLQDCFLMVCMWFLLGWTPQTVLGHIPAGTHERWSAIGTILAGFLLLFGPAFLWILENNDTHVERQRTIRQVEASDVLAKLAHATSSLDRIETLPSRVIELRRSVKSSRKVRNPELSQREFIIRLSGHTAAQNSIALILAVTTVIGIIGVSSGLAPNAVGTAGLPAGD
jgi:hypothetical protein